MKRHEVVTMYETAKAQNIKLLTDSKDMGLVILLAGKLHGTNLLDFEIAGQSSQTHTFAQYLNINASSNKMSYLMTEALAITIQDARYSCILNIINACSAEVVLKDLAKQQGIEKLLTQYPASEQVLRLVFEKMGELNEGALAELLRTMNYDILKELKNKDDGQILAQIFYSINPGLMKSQYPESTTVCDWPKYIIKNNDPAADNNNDDDELDADDSQTCAPVLYTAPYNPAYLDDITSDERKELLSKEQLTNYIANRK